MKTLSLSHMSKAYGGVPALSDVSLRLTAGRVHALMGENGAGKSTLIKLIAGVTPADSLTVDQDGVQIPIAAPKDADKAGFRFIHQELNIVPQISVAENILLGRPYPRRFGALIDWPKVRAQAKAALDALGAPHIDVSTLAADLTPGDKMLIKIAAALVAGEGPAVTLYVLDEPTAALTGAESEMLFDVITRLKEQGAAVLYVSHRLDEVLRICDDVTVLRDGKHVSTCAVKDTTKDRIIHDMTGRDVADAYPASLGPIADTPVLRLNRVETDHLSGLTFDLHAGEVLGIAGLAEAGQSYLLRLLMGLGHIRHGTTQFEGHSLPNSPAQAWAKGIAHIPRERRAEALCLDLPIRSNIVLPHLSRYGFRANKRAELKDAQTLADQTRLKCTGLDQPVGQLSGGNQQKVVFARALAGNPKLLLLDEPTRGVDVGAKFDIYQLVRQLAAQGCAVILTSTDLPEILGMCDRVLVLHAGAQAHLLDRAGLTSADLLAHFYANPDGERPAL